MLESKLNSMLEEITCWSELKIKLSKYNTSIEKNGIKNTQAGKIFEVFAKYYFQIEPTLKDDYKNVWLYDEIPLNIKRKLNIGNVEHGVDLLLEDDDENFIPVQCKFKNDEKQKLSWSKDKISNLFAFIPNASRYIVFTNASDIDVVSKTRYIDAFSFIGLQHLHEIDLETFQNIKSSLETRQLHAKHTKFKPYNFQQNIIDKSRVYFNNNERGQLILPCGAGKTLVSLWIKENLNSQKNLVLVPSLALLRQIKNEWAIHRNSEYQHICVCSEKTINNDIIDSYEVHSYDLDSRVTTNPEIIRNFILNKERFVIFSTYQSLSAIADAVKNIDFEFDFVICDEAHKTAGTETSVFGLIHNADIVPSKKRLYMTATPRVFSQTIKKNLQSKESLFLYDMSDPEIFGKSIHFMSFKEAIEKGILVDYKIISVGINSDEVKEYVDNRYILDKKISVDIVANILALEKVFKKYEVTHAITFHSRVSYAKTFSELGSKLYPDISTYSISGKDTTSTRSNLLKEFINSPKAIMSNSRCLTEGVDVPAIDLVYFCDPKNSKIDIVQATGRALRLDKNKCDKIGYIIVPIYHTNKENIEDAIDKSTFKSLIQIIRSMAEQDERLQDKINSLAFSKGKLTKDSKHFEYMDTSVEEQSLLVFDNFSEKFKKALFTQVIEKASIVWDLKLLELKEWLCKYNEYPEKEENENLYSWIGNQRSFYRKKCLSGYRIEKLETINFVWDYHEYSWKRNLQILQDWRIKNPNLWPKQRNSVGIEKKLAIWMLKIGKEYKNGTIEEAQFEQLINMGYVFENRKWHEKFEELKSFIERNERFPLKTSDKLYSFYYSELKKNEDGKHDKVQEKLLRSIDFYNNINLSKIDQWNVIFENLRIYVNKNNKMPPAHFPLSKKIKFGSFVNIMREKYKKGFLEKQKEEKLREIGFILDGNKKRKNDWDFLFELLVLFRNDNPKRWPNCNIKDESQLAAWCLHQKQWYSGKLAKYGEYHKHRKIQLDSISFEWEITKGVFGYTNVVTWDERLTQYIEYKKENPKRKIPSKINKERNHLYIWLAMSKTKYLRNQLSDEKIEKLRNAGVEWII